MCNKKEESMIINLQINTSSSHRQLIKSIRTLLVRGSYGGNVINWGCTSVYNEQWIGKFFVKVKIFKYGPEFL